MNERHRSRNQPVAMIVAAPLASSRIVKEFGLIAETLNTAPAASGESHASEAPDVCCTRHTSVQANARPPFPTSGKAGALMVCGGLK